MPYYLLRPYIRMLGELDREEMLRGISVVSAPHMKPQDRRKFIQQLERKSTGARKRRRQLRGAEMMQAFGAMGLPVKRATPGEAAS